MAFRIEATVVSGLGAASGRNSDPKKGTVVLQKPHLEKYLPEIVNCFDGTINLLLDHSG